MSNKINIEAFALAFHLKKSNSHKTIVEDPLHSRLSFSFRAWNGIDLPVIKDKSKPLLFFQYPPPRGLLEDAKVQIVWLPMWDHVRGYSQKWWNSLPKTVRIIAFSKEVSRKAKQANLKTLNLQYFISPTKLKRVTWKNGRVLFYWNRIGLIGKKDLEKLCFALKVEKMYFQNQLDPGIIKTLDYDLPTILGKTEVIKLPHYLSRKQYLQVLENANIYIAPRVYEGIGISFIEALSRGACVLAVDNPTMNEYIQHKKNGYLLSYKKTEGFIESIKHAAGIRIPEAIGGKRKQINVALNISEIQNLNIKKLGDQAYKENKNGYKIWESKIEEYSNFIVNW